MFIGVCSVVNARTVVSYRRFGGIAGQLPVLIDGQSFFGGVFAACKAFVHRYQDRVKLQLILDTHTKRTTYDTCWSGLVYSSCYITSKTFCAYRIDKIKPGVFLYQILGHGTLLFSRLPLRIIYGHSVPLGLNLQIPTCLARYLQQSLYPSTFPVSLKHCKINWRKTAWDNARSPSLLGYRILHRMQIILVWQTTAIEASTTLSRMTSRCRYYTIPHLANAKAWFNSRQPFLMQHSRSGRGFCQGIHTRWNC